MARPLFRIEFACLGFLFIVVLSFLISESSLAVTTVGNDVSV